MILDVDGADGTSFDAAKSIDHSLQKMDTQQKLKLAGFATDAGGGGTGNSLTAKLKMVDWIKDEMRYATCSIH